MTHRDLCRLAARWLLTARWCRVAAYEVGGVGDVFDAIGVSDVPDPERNDLLRAERAWAAAEWDRRDGAVQARRQQGQGLCVRRSGVTFEFSGEAAEETVAVLLRWLAGLACGGVAGAGGEG